MCLDVLWTLYPWEMEMKRKSFPALNLCFIKTKNFPFLKICKPWEPRPWCLWWELSRIPCSVRILYIVITWLNKFVFISMSNSWMKLKNVLGQCRKFVEILWLSWLVSGPTESDCHLKSHEPDGVGLDLDLSLTIARQPTLDSTYRESENKAVDELMLQNN